MEDDGAQAAAVAGRDPALSGAKSRRQEPFRPALAGAPQALLENGARVGSGFFSLLTKGVRGACAPPSNGNGAGPGGGRPLPGQVPGDAATLCGGPAAAAGYRHPPYPAPSRRGRRSGRPRRPRRPGGQHPQATAALQATAAGECPLRALRGRHRNSGPPLERTPRLRERSHLRVRRSTRTRRQSAVSEPVRSGWRRHSGTCTNSRTILCSSRCWRSLTVRTPATLSRSAICGQPTKRSCVGPSG